MSSLTCNVIEVDGLVNTGESYKHNLFLTMQRLSLAKGSTLFTVDGLTFTSNGTYTVTYSDGITTAVYLSGEDNDEQ